LLGRNRIANFARRQRHIKRLLWEIQSHMVTDLETHQLFRKTPENLVRETERGRRPENAQSGASPVSPPRRYDRLGHLPDAGAAGKVPARRHHPTAVGRALAAERVEKESPRQKSEPEIAEGEHCLRFPVGI
jgi:hypothetical protein